MSRVEQYLEAATRANTRRSYEAATRHFEVDWGGQALVVQHSRRLRHGLRETGRLAWSLSET